MRDRTSKAFAARLPAAEAAEIETALEETGQLRSEFVRRAIRYYIDQNPDEIAVLYPQNSINRFMTELGENDA